jgi:hypothetical protein
MIAELGDVFRIIGSLSVMAFAMIFNWPAHL